MPTVDEQGQQRYFQRVITPRPLDYGSGSLPRAGVFCHWRSHGAQPATGAGEVEPETPGG